MTFNEIKAKIQIMLEDEQEKTDKVFRNNMLELGALRLIKKFKLRPTVFVSDKKN